MLFASVLLSFALAGVSRAQTPESFTPKVDAKLDVMFNSTAVTTPGLQLSKAITAFQPQIAIMNAEQDATFMYLMIDLDVPPAANSTSRRTLLHALQPGFKATEQRTPSSFNLLVTTDAPAAPYIGPGPPANDTVAHRYVSLLFNQPAAFAIQVNAFADIQQRIGFDVQQFMTSNHLGEPVAGNFFTVDGRVQNGLLPGVGGNATATATATGSGGIVRNTLVPFEGAAGKKEGSLAMVGVLGGLAAMMAAV